MHSIIEHELCMSCISHSLNLVAKYSVKLPKGIPLYLYIVISQNLIINL